MLTQAITILQPNGIEEVIPQEEFCWENSRKILDGYVELVRVLRSDLEGFIFTYMLVDEEGMLKDKSINEEATKLYRANIQRQFPSAKNPFEEANINFDKMAKERGISIFNTQSLKERNNPQIYGTVIWFKGYTCEECEREGLI